MSKSAKSDTLHIYHYYRPDNRNREDITPYITYYYTMIYRCIFIHIAKVYKQRSQIQTIQFSTLEEVKKIIKNDIKICRMKNICYLCSVQTYQRCIAYAKKLTIFAPTYANTLYKCSVAVMPERSAV